ncbi:MAG TPA: peptidase U32, partial [Treponema sp.]|nr:peptidase U32 [Treponema sp.]
MNTMELLSPAGNAEKLYYAYAYGADAAYIGLKKFSLRVKADNFYDDEYKKVTDLKKRFPGRKLHCALNISFHNNDIEAFKNNIDYFRLYPIDAFIVQDLGIVSLLQKEFPDAALHVSTQASCINYEAVKMYQGLGFKRVVLGREVSL